MASPSSTALVIITIFLFINMHFQGVSAYNGGWQSAHATFYGGGNAAGTMGKFSFYFQLLQFNYYMYQSITIQEN